MNATRLTDAQVSQALRAHLPDRAQAGLRERILEAAETTGQQRALPSFLGALTAAGPVTLRRSLLLAAALLLALAVATAAAVGAWRLLQRNVTPDISLEPPADLPAFVLSSYERLPALPPLALTWQDDDGSAKGRIYVHRSGAVRFDRFTSADATEPSSYTILSANRISGMAPVESEAVWVEPGHEAFGEDPRVWIRTVLSPEGGPGCEMERDPNAIGNGTAATGWSYVGVEYVAGRPAHRVSCVEDLWLDIETRLILRMGAPLTDEAGQPIPGKFATKEITEIAFGEQPDALFEPPEGVAHMTSEAYSAYLCTRDVRTEEEVGFGVRDCAATEPEATPLPTPTPKATARPSPLGPAGPLAWTQASLTEDWPAPVRPEPAGGAILVPIITKHETSSDRRTPDRHIDPSGDTGSDGFPWVDIQEVRVGPDGLGFTLLEFPPDVDPTEQWIAYGVVFDDDHDGVPDRRVGKDNTPGTVAGWNENYRVWITDLHTGRTTVEEGNYVGETYVNAWSHGRFSFGTDLTGGGHKGTSLVNRPLYLWASVIENGRVVATDYAPDVGWLDTSVQTKP